MLNWDWIKGRLWVVAIVLLWIMGLLVAYWDLEIHP